MVTKTLFLEFCLIFQIFCYKPEISENVKMVVVYGAPYSMMGEISAPGSDNWADCLDTCWKQWNCVLVSQQPWSDTCKLYTIPGTPSVQKKVTSDKNKVGIKISLPSDTCPRESETEAPPLFGNVSSTLIITDGLGTYYKSEITDTPTDWDLTFYTHKCLTDIPEDYYPYEHKLTSPFLPGETFFMRGKTAGFNEQTSISFWNKEANDWAIYIMINEDRNNENNIVISTYKNGVLLERDDGMNNLQNPYGYYTDFEIRVTSDDTVAKISFDGTEYEYELYPDVPLTEIDHFTVNVNGGTYGYQTGTVDFLGWTGDCESNIVAIKPVPLISWDGPAIVSTQSQTSCLTYTSPSDSSRPHPSVYSKKWVKDCRIDLTRDL
ncbi:hypothetical protein CRE_22169 [Caenorhabditis remanei]|uniref:Galectin domain-containing protein n=1 Tax=Caenorhabditis remanei TaxID=31234 RepID=E3NKW5_CAERE|nr:hypothetical protein CRE_22169 [Caenorhabditis remanei]